MVKVTLNLPEGIADAFGGTAESRERTVLEDAVIEAYREGRLSHRQVGTVLGLDYWQTEQLFRRRGVPLNYTTGDVEMDRVTLKRSAGPVSAVVSDTSPGLIDFSAAAQKLLATGARIDRDLIAAAALRLSKR